MAQIAEVFKSVSPRRKSIRSAERLARAFTLRDAAVVLVRAQGHWETVRNVGGNLLVADIGPLHLLHDTPFTKKPAAPESLRYFAALRGKPLNRGYGMNVWAADKGKVFFVEWDTPVDLEIVSFHRGDWEDALLALAHGIVDEGKAAVGA